MEFDQVKSIAILCDAADYWQAMAFQAKLQAMGKKVRVWFYAEVEDPIWDYAPSRRFLTRHHLDFFFFPKKYLLDDFQGFPADMLMNLSRSSQSVLEYLSLQSPAHFRVAFDAQKAKYYDFVLSVDPENSSFEENAESLLFYLKNLRLK